METDRRHKEGQGNGDEDGGTLDYMQREAQLQRDLAALPQLYRKMAAMEDQEARLAQEGSFSAAARCAEALVEHQSEAERLVRSNETEQPTARAHRQTRRRAALPSSFSLSSFGLFLVQLVTVSCKY